MIILGGLGLAYAACALDPWLLVRLYVIASEASAPAGPALVDLLPEHSDELKQYSPARLSRFLSYPSPTIRAVVSRSLSERSNDRDPARWKGVIPRLLAEAERDPKHRDETFYRVPCLPPEDVDAIVAFVERNDANDDSGAICNYLVGRIYSAVPERRSWAMARFQSWIDSPSADFRRSAFQQMVALAPDAPESLAAFRKLMDSGDAKGIGARGGRELLSRHPELIDAFLDGNPAQRELIWSIAAEDANAKFNKSPNTPRPFLVEAHLKRLEPIALERFKKALGQPLMVVPTAANRDLSETSIFLLYRPTGAATFFDVARQTRGTQRAYATSWASVALKSTSESIDPCLADLLKWLNEDDADVQRKVIQVFADWALRLQKERPKDHESVVAAVRQMLDRFPGREDAACVDFLFQASPTLRDEDADRIADAIYRICQKYEKDHLQTPAAKRSQKTTAPAQADEIERRLAASPHLKNRPAVKRCLDLRKSLEAKNIFMTAAGIAELQRKSNNQNMPPQPAR